MSKVWDDVKNAIVDGYVYAADKAEELTQIGRARVEILGVNRRIAHTMSEVGGRVFELFEGDQAGEIADDADVLAGIEKIKSHREELDRLKAELEKVREAREAAHGASGGSGDADTSGG